MVKTLLYSEKIPTVPAHRDVFCQLRRTRIYLPASRASLIAKSSTAVGDGM